MPNDFEDQVCGVTQQLLTSINAQSLEVESRNKYTTLLMAELETQTDELLAAARALAAASRSCSFDIGIRLKQSNNE